MQNYFFSLALIFPNRQADIILIRLFYLSRLEIIISHAFNIKWSGTSYQTSFDLDLILIYHLRTTTTQWSTITPKCTLFEKWWILSFVFSCCKMHDWCYTTTTCMGFEWNLPYFVPFKWKCNGGAPYCSKSPFLYLRQSLS